MAEPTSNSASSDPPVDRTFYTWSNFFSILTNTASPSAREAYFNTKDVLNEKRDCERCTADVKDLFRRSPIITFMKQNIDLLSPTDSNGQPTASISPANVRCRRCTAHMSGGFSPEHGILLCANTFRNRGHLEDTLAHEMVHAYDHLRFEMDPVHDLRHAACMEIRASTLSGECRFMREFFTRGQYHLGLGFTQHMQECVRRRAAIAVRARPGCKDDVHAVRVVNEVFDKCFNDTRPFDEIYK